jgi:hypothetical protein
MKFSKRNKKFLDFYVWIISEKKIEKKIKTKIFSKKIGMRGKIRIRIKIKN